MAFLILASSWSSIEGRSLVSVSSEQLMRSQSSLWWVALSDWPLEGTAAVVEVDILNDDCVSAVIIFESVVKWLCEVRRWISCGKVIVFDGRRKSDTLCKLGRIVRLRESRGLSTEEMMGKGEILYSKREGGPSFL